MIYTRTAIPLLFIHTHLYISYLCCCGFCLRYWVYNCARISIDIAYLVRRDETYQQYNSSKKHLETRVPCMFHNKAITYYVAFNMPDPEVRVYLHDTQFEIILKVTVRQYDCYNTDYCVKILYARIWHQRSNFVLLN